MASLLRLFRTLRSLHPLQIAARPLQLVTSRAIMAVPKLAPPAVRGDWPAPPSALIALANAERDRARQRLTHLPFGSRLRAYEEMYGLELGGDSKGLLPDWRAHVAIEPFPASVRARRLAVAIRLGRQNLEGELARACRAIFLQPELHLMGNHLLENALGLVCGGAVACGVEADAWWKAGALLLQWQLDEQFLPDGGHFERSVSYHLALTAGLLEAIELADASGRGAPESWRDVAKRALSWADAVRAPDGTYPLFNDASLDAAPQLDNVRALGEACKVEPTKDPATTLHLLPDTGWALLRAADHSWLAFDAGPDGAPYQPGHAHADALTFELWVRGERAIVDYGVSSYGQDLGREQTRATYSHNTVEVAGENSSEVWGSFRVGRRAHADIVGMRQDDVGARITARHDGYRWLPGAPVHEREIELQPGALTVWDRLVGPGSAISRLRVDDAAAKKLVITGSGPITAEPAMWYPNHAQARDAVVLAQRVDSGEAQWNVRW